jgi:hypothetical protein
VSWYSLIWRHHAIPKQALILWLAVNNRLTTGDRLFAWGFKGDTSCVFCKGMNECRDHIFFSCGFSSRIWKACFQRCDILILPNSWEDLIADGSKKWKTKTLLGAICRLILSSVVYSLWMARNEIKFGSHPKTEEQILKQIFWEIRSRISGKGKFPKTMENVHLCHKWNIDVDILI